MVFVPTVIDVAPVNAPPANGKNTPAPGVSPSAYALVTKFAAAVGVIPLTKPVKDHVVPVKSPVTPTVPPTVKLLVPLMVKLPVKTPPVKSK